MGTDVSLHILCGYSKWGPHNVGFSNAPKARVEGGSDEPSLEDVCLRIFREEDTHTVNGFMDCIPWTAISAS